ncbi:MAG: pilin [Steroidobacteraceae bacterium]
MTEGMNLAASVKAGVAEYYADHGSWPTALIGTDEGDLGYTANPTGKYVSGIALADTGGGINITYGLQANSKITGEVLSIRPGLGANGDIVWVCGKASTTGITTAPTGDDETTLDAKYLPSSCRP